MAAALGTRPSFAPLGLGLLLYTLSRDRRHLRAAGLALLLGVTAWLAPLLWLVGPAQFALLGWEHVLQASRLVTAAATIATGAVLAWLTANLTRNQEDRLHHRHPA